MPARTKTDPRWTYEVEGVRLAADEHARFLVHTDARAADEITFAEAHGSESDIDSLRWLARTLRTGDYAYAMRQVGMMDTACRDLIPPCALAYLRARRRATINI